MLLIAEVIAPGFFLMFIGAAAVATGLLALLLPIGVAVQLALFAILALTVVRFGGRRAYASRYDHASDPLLNDRVGRLLGRVVVVVSQSMPMVAGCALAIATGPRAGVPPQSAIESGSSMSTAIA